MNAYEQGLEWGSCKEALEMRKNYANQPDWWKACDRGDWLLWQLAHLSEEMYEKLQSQIQIAVDIIVARAVTNHTLHCGIPKVEIWAKNWLNGTDRSWGAAWDAVGAAARAAARAAAWSAAWSAELKRQADDIHKLIPNWPEGE